ncbi:hypothetical protein T265_04938 [Opisthorchis viverrini]|uniref:Uncharacterized protein n=1 Tax=Opisthorchis viverrini TaxID=6198 RepID=A0A074ZMB0_OPIVI|nr:hypothetical protein T265_04938 [Opisthorchis viverrini]KER28181.1 hypothetical protein T265_04938 [Opisthorchis viverrini]
MANSEDLKPNKVLQQFISCLPANERAHVTSLLLQIRRNLAEVIPPKRSIKQYLTLIHELNGFFSRLPLHVRGNLTSLLLNGLECSFRQSSISFAIFTTCLCLLELGALRNVDRLDLEGRGVWTVIERLNSNILPELSDHVSLQRTNMPTLCAWAMGMLIFSFTACYEWLQCRRCGPDSQENFLNFNQNVLQHPSLPAVMKSLLTLQSKHRPFPTPPEPYSLFDLLFSSAVSSNSNLFEHCKAPASISSDQSPLELSEPAVGAETTVLSIHTTKPPHEYLLNSQDLENLTPCSLANQLQTGTPDQIMAFLKVFTVCFKQPLSTTSDEFVERLITTLRHTTHILTRLYPTSSECSSTSAIYEQAYCCLVQMWYRAAEQRTLLVAFPQSYLWLAGLMRPRYEASLNFPVLQLFALYTVYTVFFMNGFQCLSQSGFVRAVACLSRFITAYQALFRSQILASPHWYLQLITDVVIAVIDRLEEGQRNPSDQLEEAMCSCLVAISRPYSALNATDPTVRPELSRAIKTPLECIISRMASCRSAVCQRVKMGDKPISTQNTELLHRPAIGPRLRDILTNYLLYPMLQVIDTWALGQMRIGIRPAAAKVLLMQLVNEAECYWEGPRPSQSRMTLPKTAVAVGGLHVAEKLAVKHKR